MAYLLHWVGFMILSSIALSITGLSIHTAFVNGHYFMFVLKFAIFIMIVLELYKEGKSLKESKSIILRKHNNIIKQSSIVLSIVLGGLSTFLIGNYFGINSVIMAGAVGIVANMFFKEYQIPIYCGSFAGMASALIFTDVYQIFISTLFTGILFILSQEILKGFGGKLGATAFFGTFMTVVLYGKYHETLSYTQVNIQIEIIICFILGAIFAHQVHLLTGKSTVLTSGVSGVLAGIILPIIYSVNGLTFAAALFSGAFLGMTGEGRFTKTSYFLLASVVGGIIFIYSQPYFNGLGGKLGAIAFISSLTMTQVKMALSHFRK